MPVVFDLLGAQNRDHGERGIARLVSQLAIATERTHPDLIDRYLLHPHLPLPDSLLPLVDTGKVVRADQYAPDPFRGGTFIAGSLIELEEDLRTVLPHWARSAAWTTLAVLYDLIPLKFPDAYLTESGLRAAYLDRVAGYGLFDGVLPISIASRDDAVELLGVPANRQAVIYAGVDDRFGPAGAGDEMPPIEGLRPEYVLFPTGIDWRKNIDRTLEAYAALERSVRDRHQLVLACRLDPWVEEDLRDRGHRLGLEPDHLVLPGYLPDEDLIALNQHAILAIFPSLYEGFGLPALEAMRCAIPVLCADSSSLREVQPFEPARFDPESTESIRAALANGLANEEFRRAVVANQGTDFTWDRSAELMANAVRNLGDQRTVAKSPRPRIAVVTPLPPQPSGIAYYSARLLPELARFASVSAFTAVNDEEGHVEFDPVLGCGLHGLDELEEMHFGGQPFDRIVYMMGNSRFHVQALQMLGRLPGAVLFHDARYVGLYNELYRLDPRRLGADHVGHRLNQLYPDRYRPAVVQSHTIDPTTSVRFGILMAAEIMSVATQMLCHSEHAARLLTLDTGATVDHIFDLPVPRLEPAATHRESSVVGVFGIVDPAKNPELVIEACSLVPGAGMTVRFVGECEPLLRDHLQQRADDVAVAVEFTGPIDSDRFLRQQRSVTIAVQLRRFSNGESSGALAELIAAETPTITTRLGAAAELPVDVVETASPEVSSGELAEQISRLTSDPYLTLRMAEAMRRYSEANSYSRAARRLIDKLGLT
ncbi:MAG: glycosyltransferase [Acidimicrobiales bacterium]